MGLIITNSLTQLSSVLRPITQDQRVRTRAFGVPVKTVKVNLGSLDRKDRGWFGAPGPHLVMVKPLLHYQYLASFWPGRILCQSSRYFLKERGGGLGFYVGLNLRMTRSPKIYKIPLVTDALKMANKIKRKEYPVKKAVPLLAEALSRDHDG